MRITDCLLILLLSWLVVANSGTVSATERWQAGFKAGPAKATRADSVLTFDDVLGLAAAHNPTLRSLEYRCEAALGRVEQAGLRPRPELEVGFEEVGWDSPGFAESEISVSLSQEFDLFGKRRARRGRAEAGRHALELQTKLTAFDLYLETKRRFLGLVHAREHHRLAERSVELAENILADIEFRINKGAALQSEVLLAKLEHQRLVLDRAEAGQKENAARISLVSLWAGDAQHLAISEPLEPDFDFLSGQIASTIGRPDSTRAMMVLANQEEILKAEMSLVQREAKPNLTLSGGYRRIESDNSNSFLFGIALPLPLRNINQGARRSLEAELRALEFETKQARIDAASQLRCDHERLRLLVRRHAALDSLLLPTAEETYEAVNEAYQAGRLPFTSLLEAERSLIQLRIDHNNLLLSIYEQIISLERLTGMTVHAITD